MYHTNICKRHFGGAAPQLDPVSASDPNRRLGNRSVFLRILFDPNLPVGLRIALCRNRERSTRHRGRQNRGRLRHFRGHHRVNIPKNRGPPRHFHRPRRVNIPRCHLLPGKRCSTDYTVLDGLRLGADNFWDNGEMDLIHSFGV